ncbi:hypothetical protein POVWA2_003110 [Plasmodium ovale wallikeri]|uniref:Uncharacterized protein n=1 Tax=Plasmodium ovale wallikeri TaxID=864142 RepID=A0A1A8YI55_PLAOA|nr:hypothetical protein POVWA1_002930 [Plasmodium ovale wallikeri]SBT31239.1 hypothetical protein POVWA2_003110 [Plasmodium ovale wallikeri]
MGWVYARKAVHKRELNSPAKSCRSVSLLLSLREDVLLLGIASIEEVKCKPSANTCVHMDVPIDDQTPARELCM